MKKSLLSLAALAAISSSAWATDPAATGTLNANATSSVSGGAATLSVLPSTGGTSAHFAGSFATNTSVAGASLSLSGSEGSALTGAATHGKTFTFGGGFGSGGTFALANQGGLANAEVDATIGTAGVTNVSGELHASSLAQVGTGSVVSTVDGQDAVSWSKGGAFDVSGVHVTSAALQQGVTTTATGFSLGGSYVKGGGYGASGTWAVGGYAFDLSTYSGSISRSITGTVTVPGGGGGGGEGEPPPSGNSGENNGWGNGDQNAPGNSCTHNNAENNGCTE